jgi:hypothetical protein
MRGLTYFLTALCIGLASLVGCAERASAQQSPVTAIDIALEPDATMIQRASAANARLLNAVPKGFALDATHHPHITILQRSAPLISTESTPRLTRSLAAKAWPAGN